MIEYRNRERRYGMLTNEDMIWISELLDQKLKPLRADNEILREEMGAMRNELKGEIAQTRADLHAEIEQTRADLHAEILQTRTDLEGQIQDVASELKQTRTDLEGQIRDVANELRQTRTDLEGQIQSVANELKQTRTDLEGQIRDVAFEAHKSNLIIENIIVPRLENIEACYTGTYKRYASGIGEMTAVKEDVKILKDVVKEHSLQIKELQKKTSKNDKEN